MSGTDGDRRDRRHSGYGRGRPDLLQRRNGDQRQDRHPARHGQGALPRRGHDALRNDAVGIPGTDADGAEARQAKPMAEAIFDKWELDFAVIGEVTDTRPYGARPSTAKSCATFRSARSPTDAPEYERPYVSKEEYKAWAQVKPLGDIPESTDIGADLLKMMASPALASRRWIWEQYDSQVGADTLQTGGDAAVVRVHGTNKALAMTTDCTPRYCYADPYEGGKQAVAEAYRNLCAVGARPLAITNCLNFGNPQRPEIMAQFVGCLEGMGEACRALDFPIVSGNVSLYNESKATGGGSAILPTPAIGGVGILEDYSKMMTIGFKAESESILFLRRHGLDRTWANRLWLREVHGRKEGTPPADRSRRRTQDRRICSQSYC